MPTTCWPRMLVTPEVLLSDELVHPRLVVYVDVDDTLVRTVGGKRIPMSDAVDHVRALSAEGAELYCWMISP
jgi:hypothetical protein